MIQAATTITTKTIATSSTTDRTLVEGLFVASDWLDSASRRQGGATRGVMRTKFDAQDLKAANLPIVEAC